MLRYTYFKFYFLVFIIFPCQADFLAQSKAHATNTYTSYSLGPICHPAVEIQSPRTTAEVLEIVRFAIAMNLTVKAFGSRHSLTDIICTNGIPVNMGNLKEILVLNPDQSVTVSAGYTLRELGEFLHKNGRSLQGSPAFGEITIGGAIGTGAHGSSLKYTTSISDFVIGLKIIDGLGEIRYISTDEQLRAYRVHLGLLGIVVEVTLKTVPDFKITGHNYELPDEILTNGEWKKLVYSSDFICFYWFPSSKSVIVANGTIVPITTPGKGQTNFVPKTTTLFYNFFRPSVEALQALDIYSGLALAEDSGKSLFLRSTHGVSPFYSEDGGNTFKNPSTGYRYLMQESVCSPNCLWQHFPFEPANMDNSIALNMDDFEDVIRTVKQILEESKAVFLLTGIWLRFVNASDSYLAPNYGRNTFYLEFFMIRRQDWYEDASSGISAFQTILQALTFKYKGRSHWGKTGLVYHSRDMIQRKLNTENRQAFLAIREMVDPNRIFLNDFGRRLLNESDAINFDPMTSHCALQDNCICNASQTHQDCAVGQSCGHLQNFPDYSVCL